MRRPAPLLILLAVACANAPSGMDCRSDLQCDPGDSCVDGACQTPQALTGPGISVTPASASVETQAGVAPPPVHLRLASGDGRSHAYSVACAPDGTPSPASGKVTKKSPVSLSVQAGTPTDVGVHTLTCTVSSPSAPSVQVPITVTATGIPPQGGPPPIGPGGGTVDLLDFVLTGDTRPPACDDTAGYPTAIHQQIVRAMAALHPQMALDLGDHMYVCAQNLAMAQQQMALYTEPLAGFPALVFMTMGNHECESTDCSANPADANYTAYSQALKQVSQQEAPNYALQIQTRLGRVTLAVVADNFFGATQQAWLESTLADADANSIVTMVAKHHPGTGQRTGPAAPWRIINQHKYSLLLTAHDHNYQHNQTAFSGRSVICGLGGANPANTGFCRVQQTADGLLHFTQYDATGNPHDTWSVTAR